MANLSRFARSIQEASARYGIPVGLLERQIMAESGGNPGAESPMGAVGLMQLMPETAKGLGVSNPYDPHQSIMGGARYLAEQKQKFGNWREALAAYNAGPGAVAKYGGVPPFAETKAYVQKILGGLPSPTSVGAAPQESLPALTASAGLGDSAPTHQMDMLGLAQKLMGPSDMPDPPGVEEPKLASDLGALDWRQFLPGGHKGNAGNSALQGMGQVPRFSVDLQGGGGVHGIVQAAKGYLGVPYKWGGTSRQGGMDCSGFLQNVMKDVGVKIGRTTYEQVKEGSPVDLKHLQPGDAVFTEPGHAGPNHVGLYVGHGMIQESPHTGTVNSYIPLKNFLGGGFVAARRYTGHLPRPGAKGKK